VVLCSENYPQSGGDKKWRMGSSGTSKKKYMKK
jgi:hypothetical protein